MEQKKINYSIGSNFTWGTKLYEEFMGKKYHVTDGFTVMLGIVAPFIGMAFPSVTIWFLQSGYYTGRIILSVLIYALSMKLLTVSLASLVNKQQMNYFMGRISVVTPINNQLLSMDYERMESKDGQQKSQAAVNCVFRGNEYGIEKFLKQFPMLVQNGIGFILYSFLVIQISPWVFLYMAVSALLISGLSLRQGRHEDRTREFAEGLYKQRKKALEETFELSARNDIILYQAKNWLLIKLYRISDGILKFYQRYFRIKETGLISMAVLNFIRDAIVYIILIQQISRAELTVSELLLYVGTIAGYSAWVSGIVEAIQQMILQNHTVSDFRNFLAFAEQKEYKEVPEFTAIQGKRHELRLEDVCYRYEDGVKDTISHVNLTIRPSEKIALVGSNGAGKSTLVKLITGLYQPTSGKIYLDGVDIANVSKEQYYKEFAAVFQDAKVFACSVAQNVSCSMEFDKDLVKDSLTKAGLWKKVESLPLGVDTMMTKNLSSDGIEFSGGETQKLMLARALYRNAPVLILDEPTAALDPIAESRMYETYHAFGTNKTGIFISHRLSSTRFCDRVCFLKDGKITETGTHETLIEEQGDYAEMFRIQAQYYKENYTRREGEVVYE